MDGEEGEEGQGEYRWSEVQPKVASLDSRGMGRPLLDH